MDVLDNNNNIPFTPFDTHTHTHILDVFSPPPPPHVCSSIRAPGISYYMKRELNPFPFFSNPMRLSILHPTNTQTGERERERKTPFSI
jgi:hypothetical protein